MFRKIGKISAQTCMSRLDSQGRDQCLSRVCTLLLGKQHKTCSWLPEESDTLVEIIVLQNSFGHMVFLQQSGLTCHRVFPSARWIQGTWLTRLPWEKPSLPGDRNFNKLDTFTKFLTKNGLVSCLVLSDSDIECDKTLKVQVNLNFKVTVAKEASKNDHQTLQMAAAANYPFYNRWWAGTCLFSFPCLKQVKDTLDEVVIGLQFL